MAKIGDTFFILPRPRRQTPKVVTVTAVNKRWITTSDGRKWNASHLHEWGEDQYRAANIEPWSEARAARFAQLAEVERCKDFVKEAFDALGDRRNRVHLESVEVAQEAARLTEEYVAALRRLGVIDGD